MATVKRRSDRPGWWSVRWTEPDGTQRRRSFEKKTAAEKFRVDVESRLATGAAAAPTASRDTISTYGTAWLTRRTDLKPTSLESLKSMWRSQIEPVWGSRRLDRIRYQDVAAWVSDLSAGGLSASRTRQAYHLLTALLDAAVRDGLLPRNPASGVTLPRLKTTRHRYLSHAELAAFAAAARSRRLMVLVLGYTGLRWGEMAALRVEDLDQGRGRILVQRNVVIVKGQTIEGSPKTHARRAVPVPPSVLTDLVAAVEGRSPADLLFPAPQGGFLRQENERRRWWNAAAREAGVAGLVPHELRHTAASLAIAAGADVIAVARMLGHASPAMTLNRYGHLWDGGLDEVASRLDEAALSHSRPGSSGLSSA